MNRYKLTSYYTFKKRCKQTMKNDWKEEFKKRFSDPIYEVRSFRIEGNDNMDDGLESFIESLLAEQKKELLEEQKRLFMLALVHLDSSNRNSVLNTLVELESLNHHE